MNPRTVRMAKAVSEILTTEELETYGNIILNGYLNPDGSVRPAMKGWTTNYQEYFTQLPPNEYDVNPGDPTSFLYNVHNFADGGNPQWATPPKRPLPSNLTSNPNGGIACSWIFPTSDNPGAPPIDYVSLFSYIYCTPAYPELPPSSPPYGCETEVNTAGVVSFNLAWSGCGSITEFPCVDTSAGVDFSDSWGNCTNLTSFPALNLSSGTVFSYTWGGCSNLTSFPILDVSSGISFSEAWYGCSGLTSFPLLDVSSGTNFSDAWNGCQSLTTFPLLNTSSGTNFTFAWAYCSGLSSFPLLDVSSGTNFNVSWAYCSSLTSFPLLDVSSGTDFNSAWESCTSLTSFPLLDVSSGTDFSDTWISCTSLTSFPNLDFSSGLNFSSTWEDCTGLTSFPAVNFDNGEVFGYTWYDCTSLTTFPAGMFDSCTATNFSGAWGNCALTQQSVDNILVSLDTAGQSNGTVDISGGTSSAPGTSGLAAKLSLEGKGWTVITN